MADAVELRNHTPHHVTILLPDRSRLELPSRAPVPRCAVDRRDGGELTTTIGQVPLTRTRRSDDVVDLPAPTPGVMMIVALAVVEACPDRADLVFPDRQVRDAGGKVVACTALGRFGLD